jgi:uncharacterized membrane protein YfcA
VPAVPALTCLPWFTPAGASTASLIIVTANSATALTARASGAGSLGWAVVGPFAAAAILGAWDGKRLAAKVSGPVLQRAFGALPPATALFMPAGAPL